MSNNRLTRSESDSMVAGVCGGLATYLDIDPVLVRLAFVILVFASGIGIPLYIILAVITPKESEVFDIFIEKSPEELKERTRNGTTFFAGLLVLAGLYFLLGNIGFHLGWLWPVLLIGLGAWVLSRR